MTRFTPRDRITWEQDTAPDGTAQLEFCATLTNHPCSIKQISGDETYRGVKLEGHIDYVVQMYWSPEVSDRIHPSDRGRVTAGVFNGKILNVAWVKTHQPGCMAAMAEIYCRESTYVRES
jgi:hypothetical protein